MWGRLRRGPIWACLGEEVDADGGLVHVVERVVHEPCDQRCLADCCSSARLANIRPGCRVPAAAWHTALFPEKDESVHIVNLLAHTATALDCPT